MPFCPIPAGIRYWLGREIGSKNGITPFSAHRNAASPIRGTALQRLLGFRYGNLKPSGVALRYEFSLVMCLQLAVCPVCFLVEMHTGQTTSACVFDWVFTLPSGLIFHFSLLCIAFLIADAVLF